MMDDIVTQNIIGYGILNSFDVIPCAFLGVLMASGLLNGNYCHVIISWALLALYITVRVI